MHRFFRRHPVATIFTILLLLAGVVGPSALATPTGAEPEGTGLAVGFGYVLLAPLYDVWDALSILTLGQHYAVLATLILVFVAWRVIRDREERGWLVRTGVELGAAVVGLAGLLAFYAYGALGPRPMASLEVADSSVLVFDVHSHTRYSPDARQGVGPEERRAWHAAGGFHAVYVTDHRTWAGWEEGRGANPARAGEGTVLLPGLDIHWKGKDTNTLGRPERYRAAVEGNTLRVDSMYALWSRGTPRPTLLLTLPEELSGVEPATDDSIGFVGIEVTDASPKGLRQSRRDRALILAMVDSLDLAPVAATNSHGWGRTVAAWTLMELPGWRDLTPEELGPAIEERLHAERADATRVVERRSPYLGDSVPALALTVPAVGWQMLSGLGGWQRFSWLVWAWLLALGLFGDRGRRTAGQRS